jgi:kynurenine formamidase
VSLAQKHQRGWDLDLSLPVRVKQVYDLARPLRVGMPHAPTHPPYAFSLTKLHGEVVYDDGVSASSELITMGGHVGTHVDALCHVSRDGRVHGGNVVGLQSFSDGITVDPVHELQPILGPGHLVDFPQLLGRDAAPDDAVDADDFESWFSEHGGPQPGSVVLVRTGWGRHWHDNATYLGLDTGCPGIARSGGRWLGEREILAVGADTIAFEKTPAPGLEVHVHLLIERGIPIFEALDLEMLAADQVWDFFFIAIPLAIQNGTGSPVRPIALLPA